MARRRRRRGAPMPRVLRQTLCCAVLFVCLTAMKLALPGHLEQARQTLGSWLVRDADFAAAISAMGQAFSGEKSADESLGEAYTAVFGNGGEIADTAPDRYASPLEGTLTSGFGWREDPNTGAQSFHWGIDLAAEEGTEIRCFADGTVGAVGESTQLGKYLTVQHGDGLETLYAHCSAVLVASGEEVKLGQAVARVGATGNATGAHLHFEIHDGTEYLDPAEYVEVE